MIETEKNAIELFTSDEFREFGNLVNTWKSMYQSSKQNLSDFILTYEQSHCDKIAQTLLLIWPFLFILLDDAAKRNEPQQNGATQGKTPNFESDEDLARRL